MTLSHCKAASPPSPLQRQATSHVKERLLRSRSARQSTILVRAGIPGTRQPTTRWTPDPAVPQPIQTAERHPSPVAAVRERAQGNYLSLLPTLFCLWLRLALSRSPFHSEFESEPLHFSHGNSSTNTGAVTTSDGNISYDTPTHNPKRNSIPWPALDQLSPTNLKRTASHLMKEWERSLHASPSAEALEAESYVAAKDDKHD